MANLCGSIQLYPIKGKKLHKVHHLGNLTPFIRWTLLPWSESTDSSKSSGYDPVWKGSDSNLRVLQYPGRPLDGQEPNLLVEVFDAALGRKDKLIGRELLNLRSYLRLQELTQITVCVKDSMGNEAGEVCFSFKFHPMGNLKLRVINATNLHNVHHVQEQHSYVRATLVPLDVEARSCKVKGENPSWENEGRSTLLLRYDGSVDLDDLYLKVEVMDADLVGLTRKIGYKQFAVGHYINMHGKEEEKGLAINLLRPNSTTETAGHLNCIISFENDAYGAHRDVVQNTIDQAKSVAHIMVPDTRLGVGKKSEAAFRINGIAQEMMDMTHTAVWGLEQSPFFRALEEKLNIPRNSMAATILTLNVLLLSFVWIASGTRLMCTIVSTLYPAWASFKALDTKRSDDDSQWLTYWVIYGILHLIEEILASLYIKFNVVVYYTIKSLFCLWLFNPNTEGAAYLYQMVVHPFLSKHERLIDQTIEEARKKAFYDSGVRMKQK